MGEEEEGEEEEELASWGAPRRGTIRRQHFLDRDYGFLFRFRFLSSESRAHNSTCSRAVFARGALMSSSSKVGFFGTKSTRRVDGASGRPNRLRRRQSILKSGQRNEDDS